MPIIVDDGAVVFDTWNIACHLEDRYPATPSLFGGGMGRGLLLVTYFLLEWFYPVLFELMRGGATTAARKALTELGLENDPLFKLAMALEKIALEDDYFVQRKLYPNVDFYSGIVQRAIGIPVSLFTAIFALARTVGWIAQLNEMIGDPEYKIGRPRQLFNGATSRNVVPIAKR